MVKPVKPIFTVGLPRVISRQEVEKLNEALYDKGMHNDYYILVYIASADKVEFNVFYEKDFNEVKYEELKQIILDKIKPNETDNEQ